MVQTAVQTTGEYSLANITNQFIKKAFDGNISLEMLTINEFIQRTQFPIDMFMVDKFYHNLSDDMNLYITDEIIEWCGYSGEMRTQKLRFNDILKKFTMDVDYWIYDGTDAYETYYNSVNAIQFTNNDTHSTECIKIQMDKFNYPHPDTFKNNPRYNRFNHIITTADCFKEIMMMLTTKKAKTIRQYYIALDKLIKIYSQYQCYHRYRQNELLKTQNFDLFKQNDELKNMMTEMRSEQLRQTAKIDEMNGKLDRATEERAPFTICRGTHYRFRLFKLNNQTNQYYATRTQHKNANSASKKITTIYPNATILVDIEHQANAMNLFKLIGEKLGKGGRNVITIDSNHINLNAGYTEDDLIDDIIDIESDKKIV